MNGIYESVCCGDVCVCVGCVDEMYTGDVFVVSVYNMQ